MSVADRQPPPALERAVRERSGKQSGDEIRFRCPHPGQHNNGDANPSARYNLVKQVWRCDACGEGGGWTDLCKLLEVPMRPDNHQTSTQVAGYVYRHEDGTPLRRKVRWEPGFQGRPKSFTWQTRDGDGNWSKSQGDGNPKVLYGSEKLPKARDLSQHVFVVEGEKDCDTGAKIGVVAVCNPEGAGQSNQRPKWRDAYSQQLKAISTTIIADKDEPGRAHAQAIASSLNGVAASVSVLELPGEGVKDLSDWVAERMRADLRIEDIRDELDQLRSDTPPWSPDEETEGACQENEENEKNQKTTQAQQLITLASSASLFHSPDGKAFASVRVGDHEETWAITSRSFRNWLRYQFFKCEEKPPGNQALKDTIDLLSARAQFEGDELPVFTRIAGDEKTIYLDLTDPQWRAVEIAAADWRVVSHSPVKFTRGSGVKALTPPILGGSVLDLQRFINVPAESDFRLVVAWLLASLRPVGPYPLLVLQGEQGSAKSTTARILRSLVDPVASPILTTPRNERDLMVAAQNAWVLAFDNLSRVPDWLSDAFCRLATGGGFSARRLFTDAEETILEAQRPILLNGIEELATRQDLLDRALVVHLPPIREETRRTESELWKDFEAESPKIRGALLTAVSAGIRHLPTVERPSLPRMADFALWTAACESNLPWPQGAILDAYNANREVSIDLALESDSVATALLDLMNDQKDWQGTAAELLTQLEERTTERAIKAQAWPKNAQALSGRLKRAATFLRKVGIEVNSERSSSRRTLRIHKTPISCVIPVTPVTPSPETPKESGPETMTRSVTRAQDMTRSMTRAQDMTRSMTRSMTRTPSSKPPENGRYDANDENDARIRAFSKTFHGPSQEIPTDASDSSPGRNQSPER